MNELHFTDKLQENRICVKNYFHVGYIDSTGVTNRGIGFNINDIQDGFRITVETDVLCNKVLLPEDIVYTDVRYSYSEESDGVEYITGHNSVKYVSNKGVMKIIDFASQTNDGNFINIDNTYYLMRSNKYICDFFTDTKDWFGNEATEIKCGTIETKYDFLAKYGFDFKPLRNECYKNVSSRGWVVLKDGRLGVHYDSDFLTIPFSGDENDFKSIMDIFNFDWESNKTMLSCKIMTDLGFNSENAHFCYTDSDCKEFVERRSVCDKWYKTREGFKIIELKDANNELHILSTDLDWEYKGVVDTVEKLKSVLDLFKIS